MQIYCLYHHFRKVGERNVQHSQLIPISDINCCEVFVDIWCMNELNKNHLLSLFRFHSLIVLHNAYVVSIKFT